MMRSYLEYKHPLITPESIQIDPIDVLTHRRYRNRHNSNRFETSEPSKFDMPIKNQRPCSRSSIELVVFNTESYGK